MRDRIDAEMVKYCDHMEPGDAFKQVSWNILLAVPRNRKMSRTWLLSWPLMTPTTLQNKPLLQTAAWSSGS